VRSWLLIGPVGWLLGVVIATAGSLYTVDQVGRGLLDRPAYRISVAVVSRQFPQVRYDRPPATTHSASASSAPAMRSAAMFPARRARQHPTASPGRVIATPAGSAEAVCEHGAAYLIYEVPRQGFSIRDLRRGPASMASVTFMNSTGGLILRVICTANRWYPLMHVSPLSRAGG
jgi:hypothetical protein